MPRAISILLTSISTWFRSRLAMQMELIALRHQVAVYKQSISRPKLQSSDRWLWVWLSPDSVTVGRRITPPTAATERSMKLSPHAAPQYPDACLAYLSGDSLHAPAFSRRGNVHEALANWCSANCGDPH
jgi:hypothetical protein